ncbi:APC family permease [Jatrophihabitans sp. DSM 45814]
MRQHTRHTRNTLPPASSRAHLSTRGAIAMYVGALLGPSLLLLPGLAARIAGPASLLVWVGLLVLSGLLAKVFSALGTNFPNRSGVVGYAEAGLGFRAGRIVGWCFLAGVVMGAPVVCLIGASYVTALVGGGRTMTAVVAAAILLAVVGLTLAGSRATTNAQLALVAVLVVLVMVAVFGSAPSLESSNFAPFAPHGWGSLGSAASVLMLSFVGWESVAALTARLEHPAKQLPRVIGAAFGITSAIYLGLAVATVGVLGEGAGSDVPLADLLRVVIGTSGPIIAAVAAVSLTLAATNAYLSGAAELAAELRAHRDPGLPRPNAYRLQLSILVVGLAVLAMTGAGVVSTSELVALPTSLFLTVYLGCTAAATRICAGATRIAAIISCVAVAAVLCFGGWTLAVVAAIIVTAGRGRRTGRAAYLA